MATPEGYITLTANPRRVRARFENHVFGDTANALTLKEGDYPPVQYFPREDVETGFLSKTEKTSHCPHKGDASYYSLFINGDLAENVAWSYETPIAGMEAIAGRIAFYPDRVDVYEVEPEIEQRSAGMRTADEVDAGTSFSAR